MASTSDRPQPLLYRLVGEMAIFRQPRREGSSGRYFRNVLPFGSSEHTDPEHDSAITIQHPYLREQRR